MVEISRKLWKLWKPRLLTSWSHNFWSLDFWVPYLFRNFKRRSIQGCQDQPDQRRFEVGGPWRAATSIFALKAINSPRHTPNKEDTHFSEIFLLPRCSLLFFSLPNAKKHPKTIQKTRQSLLILPFSPRTQGIAFALNLPFLGSTLWIWGLGVWM